jgi:DNA-binding CsgD family transcriptional regulator/N-acetylneuraminic acid mutarotase
MSDHETATPLSERELQVLQMVATGASNQQIARQLVISVNTVKVHLRNIFEKLEVQSRTEATLRAIQEGWIAVADDDAAATETTPLTPKTYLLSDRQPALVQWQQVYLAFAVLLAVVTVVTPLMLKNISQNSLYLPLPIPKENETSFYPQAPTPTPAAPQNGGEVNHWAFQAPMPTHRAGLGLVAFGEQLFAIGGIRENSGATRLVEIYDPNTDTWTEGTSKPTAIGNVSGAVLGDKIYVPGGCTNDRQAIDALEIYDPKTDAWTQGEPLPEPRCGYGLVALEDKLYLFGGWNGQAFEDTVFVFSARENEWAVMDSRMPEAKGYVGAAVLEETIYVVGGYDGRNEFNQTYVFVPETGEWLEKSPMKEKRGGLGLVSAANQLYAIGGGWQRPLTTSEKYDPTTNTWTTFEAPFADLWRNSGLVVVGTKIYAVGGWNGTEGKYMDSVVSYQVLYQLFLPISVGSGN